jgi:hypothetical protein
VPSDANNTLGGSNNPPASNVTKVPVKAALSVTSDAGSQGQVMSIDGDNSSQDSNYEIMDAMANDSTNDQQDENSMDTTEPEPEPMKRPVITPQPRIVSQLNEDSQGSNTSHFNLPPGNKSVLSFVKIIVRLNNSLRFDKIMNRKNLLV